ncbi:ComEA family DNA-binding protein [Microbacterium sp. ASV81]|uniref:ComEA family DNA-binding protein n=2 Tax=Microbacterium capsulatum TaxID=3041921 RepID=A0ABU0XDD8_9MICO|nr:ComEA family DNA-binding protein [Microbacterium sp. ASV81]MDQ4213136.1 ComEA family DNA-binding protein [Microbacterium sp. ASV81]
MPRAPRRIRLGLGAAVVVALVAVSVTVGVGLLVRSPTAPESVPVSPRATAGRSGISAGSLYVHVLGQVARPGLYVLDDGARVAEALAAAGGTLPAADMGAVNLARPLVDGEQILVPAAGETAPGAAAGGASGAGGGASGAGGGSGKAGGLIDLNTADLATLDELPRIGPALAQRIIDWRTANGRFTSVDDLLGVPGIGDKMLASIRDLVRV